MNNNLTVKGNFPIDKFEKIRTPFYYYDATVLRQTLHVVKECADKHNFQIHYAIKANANPKVLAIINEFGLGTDCVSGGEVQAALDAGFPASKIVFAGVGKADWEIELGLDNDIFCFNVESIPELEVINEIAARKGKTAQIELRLNPNVSANTHHYITTGLAENKFGIHLVQLDEVLCAIESMKHIRLIGIHFHIGSQITDLASFKSLCTKVNEIQHIFDEKGIKLTHINVGGGLGIDYHHPNHYPIAQFKEYFDLFAKHLNLRPDQTLHFEPGRSIVAQCGSLITRVLYIKEGINKQFAIVDGGMSDLIRPALYQAYHRIENISSNLPGVAYDVVGPICESSDVFGKDVELNQTKRGDLIALRSAGAYGEIMACRYNCRRLPEGHLSDEL